MIRNPCGRSGILGDGREFEQDPETPVRIRLGFLNQADIGRIGIGIPDRVYQFQTRVLLN